MFENLMNQWSELVASDALQNLLKSFAWVDYIAVTLVLLGLLYGLRKGLMRMLAEVLELVAVIVIAMHLYPKVTYYLTQTIDQLPRTAAEPLAYIVTFSLVWVLVTILDSYLKRLIKTELFWPLKFLGGGFLGVVSAIFVLGILMKAISFFPLPASKKVFEKGRSAFGAQMVQIPHKTYKIVTNPSALLKGTVEGKKQEEAL